MKAAVYYETGGPDVFRYEDVRRPACGQGRLLIDVAAIGIQGGDLLHRQGGVMATQPHIVGYQAAGTVREVGEGVDGLHRRPARRGDDGLRLACRAGERPGPRRLGRAGRARPSSDAAGIPIEFGTADDCLFEFGHLERGRDRARPGGRRRGRPGRHPAGQGGRRHGARHGVERRPPGAAARVRHGPRHQLRHRRCRPPRCCASPTARASTSSSIPSAAVPSRRSIAALAYRGRISWVGRAGREERPPDIWPIMQKNARITGVFLGAEMALQPGPHPGH